MKKKITIEVVADCDEDEKVNRQVNKFVEKVGRAFNKQLNGYKGGIFDNRVAITSQIDIKTETK